MEVHDNAAAVDTRAVYVARFTPAGSLDARSFGSTGVFMQQLGASGSDVASSNGGPLLVNADGSVDVALYADDAAGKNVWGVLALDATGALVGGFGSGGVALDTAHEYSDVEPKALVRATSGDLLLVGDASPSGPASLLVEAFNATSGGVDTSFAVNGLFLAPSSWSAQDAVVQPDGDIDIVGETQTSTPTLTATALVAQLLPSGVLNSLNFGNQGSASFPLGADSSEFLGAALDAGGELAVTGVAITAMQAEAVLARVVVHTGPSAAISYDPPGPITGQTITFTGSASDTDGTIVNQSWDLQGAGATDATGPTATVSFATPGMHTVTYFVTDGDGFTASATVGVPVFQLVDLTPVTVLPTPVVLPIVQLPPKGTPTTPTVTLAPGVTPDPATTGMSGTSANGNAKPRRPRLLHAKLVATAKGVVAPQLQCPAGSTRCKGQLELVTTQAGSSPKLALAHGVHVGAKDLVLGSGGYAIAAAHKLAVKLHLPLAGRLLLRRLHRLHAKLTFTLGAGASSTTTAVAVTVVPAKARRHA